MNIKRELYEEILATVQKPSRYLGREVNTSHKDPNAVDLRLALVFPDLYDLGLGNVGILILYAILNDLDWCWAERAYAPAPDMDEALRRRNLRLFANESKDTLDQFDALGFTLQSELTYTNILNILDLSGIPLRTADRTDAHPLTFAGGPAVFNPEPLAPFIDFFAIGDGEDIILEVAEILREYTGRGRDATLARLAEVEGIYVPALYPFETLDDGRVLPSEDAPKIRKRVVQDLDGAKFPTNYIVPYTQQVHDRIALEVLRGCTHGCRFCQAGMVTRPVRERSLENIDKLLDDTLNKTGYEEVSLVSLSTCDYSRVRTLVAQSVDRAEQDNVAVSLPSLRLDSFSVEVADMVAGPRRSGLTFAPEAASPRLRAVINKWIPDDELLRMSYEAYKRGWDHVKTYFMIGLPTERDDDVEAIVDLCRRTVLLGRTINPKAGVRTGVSTFVPKPFTPFQWAEQIGLEETERRQDILEAGFRGNSGVKFGRHAPETTFIEGLLSRADRRGGDLLEAAYRRGARLESWDEHLNIEAWKQAIDDVSYDVHYAFRERAVDERLPWDHIDVLMPKDWFAKDWAEAMELKHAPDCRHGKCHMCGVIRQERELCRSMLKNSKQGRIDETDWQWEKPARRDAEPAVQRLRLRIGRRGEVRFLSHLELMNAWVRALRRAHAPLAYSNGFHAHPRVNFASAPPVGEESEGDYMDVLLKCHVDPEALRERLAAALPDGFRLFEVDDVPLDAPSLMSSVEGFTYEIHGEADYAAAAQRARDILEADEVVIERSVKVKQRGKGRRRRMREQAEVNVRPMLAALEVEPGEGGRVVVRFRTEVQGGKTLRPREMAQLLGMDPDRAAIIKRATHLSALEGALA